MRKVIFQEWLTMDGFAADANNSPAFLESVTLNKYSDLDLLKMMDTIDTILLGANTYKLFVDFWPTATTDKEIIADKLNSTPKVVFSKTLTSVPWGKWPDARLVKTDAVAELKRLKTLEGGDLVLWGSISLAQAFMKANLIDEYHFRICPLVLGAGRPLFESTGPLDFELFETKAYESGLLLLKYRQKAG
jgi:dihydrofolate reductase